MGDKKIYIISKHHHGQTADFRDSALPQHFLLLQVKQQPQSLMQLSLNEWSVSQIPAIASSIAELAFLQLPKKLANTTH